MADLRLWQLLIAPRPRTAYYPSGARFGGFTSFGSSAGTSTGMAPFRMSGFRSLAPRKAANAPKLPRKPTVKSDDDHAAIEDDDDFLHLDEPIPGGYRPTHGGFNLGEYLPPEPPPLDETAREIVERLQNFADLPLIERAPYLGFLLNWVAHANPVMRAACLRAMSGATGFLARKTLIEALTDSDETVVLAAAESLIKGLNGEDAGSHLHVLMHPNPVVRKAACAWLHEKQIQSFALPYLLADPECAPAILATMTAEHAASHLPILLEMADAGHLPRETLVGWILAMPFSQIFELMQRAITIPRPMSEIDAIFVALVRPQGHSELDRYWTPDPWDRLWMLIVEAPTSTPRHRADHWLLAAAETLIELKAEMRWPIIASLILAGIKSGAWLRDDPDGDSMAGPLSTVGLAGIFSARVLRSPWIPASLRIAATRNLNRMGERLHDANAEQMKPILDASTTRRDDGTLDLWVISGLLRFAKRPVYDRAFQHFGEASIVAAIDADFERAIPFVCLADNQPEEQRRLMRRLFVGPIETRSLLIARLMLTLPGDRLDMIEIVDSTHAVALFAAVLTLESETIAPTLSKRKRIVTCLLAQIGPSHIQAALRIWLERDQPEDSPIGLTLFGQVAQTQDGVHLKRLAGNLDVILLPRFLRAVSACPGFPYDREYELAVALKEHPYPEVQQWVADRLSFEARRQRSANAVKPTVQRLGLCDDLDASARTIFPDVPQCLALLACHDPIPRVVGWIAAFSEDSPKFRNRLDQAMIETWRNEPNLSILGHAVLFRWDLHLKHFTTMLTAMGHTDPITRFRWALSIDSPFLRPYLWDAVMRDLRLQIIQKTRSLGDWWTEEFARLIVEFLPTNLGERIANLLVEWRHTTSLMGPLSIISGRIHELWPKLSADVQQVMKSWEPDSAADADTAPAEATTSEDIAAKSIAERIAHLRSNPNDWRVQRTLMAGEMDGVEALLELHRDPDVSPDLVFQAWDDARFWRELPLEMLQSLIADERLALPVRMTFQMRLCAPIGDPDRADDLSKLAEWIQASSAKPSHRLMAWQMLRDEHPIPPEPLVELLNLLAVDERGAPIGWALQICLNLEDKDASAQRGWNLADRANHRDVLDGTLDWLIEHAEMDNTRAITLERVLLMLRPDETERQKAYARKLYPECYSPLYIPLLIPDEYEDINRNALLCRQTPLVIKGVSRGLMMLGTERAFSICEDFLEELPSTDYTRSDVYMQLVELCDDVDIRKRAIDRTQHMRWKEPKLERVAETFAWGVREGRKLTKKLFTIQMLADNNLGYTRLNEDKIYISPLPMLRYVWNGDAIVRGLIVHEYGHHMYHKGTEPQAIWKQSQEEGIGPLLNLVSDEQLERNLRALNSRYGDDLKKLGAYAFQHSQRGIGAVELLASLGVKSFAVLSQNRLAADRDANKVGVNNGQILMAMEHAGMSFPKFMRCLRMGKPNRDHDPKVEEGMRLFRGKFRNSTMPRMQEIARELRRIFGRETDMLNQFSLDASMSGSICDLDAAGDGICDKDVQKGITAVLEGRTGKNRKPSTRGGVLSLSLNLDEEEKFEPITNIQPMPHDPVEHKQLADRVARPARQMRQFLSNLGVSMVEQKMRVRGKSIDRSRLRSAIIRSDPRILIARETQVTTDLFLGVLVDCSGSMAWNSNIEKAKLFGTLLAEAAKGHKGIDVRMFGFTDQVIYDAGNANRCGIHGLYADDGNNDAAALLHVANVAQASRRRSKLLVMISDGSPTECSVEALRGLVTRLTRRKFCCAQVAVKALDHICFPNYIVLDESNMEHGVREFGKIVARLVKKAMSQS